MFSHTVTLADGTKTTRESKRYCTHAVITVETEENAAKSIENFRAMIERYNTLPHYKNCKETLIANAEKNIANAPSRVGEQSVVSWHQGEKSAARGLRKWQSLSPLMHSFIVALDEDGDADLRCLVLAPAS